MAQLMAEQGKLEEALGVYNIAKDIFEKALGKEHPNIGACQYNIALVLQQQQKADPNAPDQMSDECKQQLQSAHGIWLKALGPDHRQTKIAASMLDEGRL